MTTKSLISPPGETILETVQLLGLSKTDLAPKLELNISQMNDLIIGQMQIDPQLAGKLESALGIKKSFWIRREDNYRIELKRK